MCIFSTVLQLSEKPFQLVLVSKVLCPFPRLQIQTETFPGLPQGREDTGGQGIFLLSPALLKVLLIPDAKAEVLLLLSVGIKLPMEEETSCCRCRLPESSSVRLLTLRVAAFPYPRFAFPLTSLIGA